MGRLQKKSIILKNEDAIIPCTMFCCDRVFSTAKNLKQHMMFHSGIMPFMCHECGKAFMTKMGVDKHVEMNHGGESVEDTLKAFIHQFCLYQRL